MPKKNGKLKFPTSNFFLLFCLLVVSILFIPTLDRPWILYDERILFQGSYFPTPSSIKEMFEIIENFGLNFNVLSSSPIYSSNYVVRTCPLSQLLGTTVSFFLEKDPYKFHLLNFILHLINTVFVFFIIKAILSADTVITNNLKSKGLKIGEYITLSALTLLWAIHPVMIEPILLSTNFGANLIYILFFAFILDFLFNYKKNNNLVRKVLIPIIFLVAMLTNEYIIMTPAILFLLSFYNTRQKADLIPAIKETLQHTLPYFVGALIYVIYFFFASHYETIQTSMQDQLLITLERIFWLAPQLFIHHIKIVLFPYVLTPDQSVYVTLGKSLLSPYPIFCTLFLLLWGFIPTIFFVFKRSFKLPFFICLGFFLALLPFIHILMPSYALVAERYLYTPLAMLVFGIALIVRSIELKDGPWKTINSSVYINTFLIILCSTFFLRSQVQTSMWSNNYSFFFTAYESSDDEFYKATRLDNLGNALKLLKEDKAKEQEEYFKKSIEHLNNAKKKLLKDKANYQQPKVISAYGLDPNSKLAQISFLESRIRMHELKEPESVGINLIKPFTDDLNKLNPKAIQLYAQLLIQKGEYNEAEKVLLKASKIYPNLGLILMPLVDLYSIYLNDQKKAEKYLIKAFKLFPYDTNILFNCFSFYNKKGDIEAAANFAYLYGLRVQSKWGYLEAFSRYLDLENYEKVEKTKGKLIALNPRDPESLYYISKYYYKIKNFNAALDLLQNAYFISVRDNGNNLLTSDIGRALSRLYLKKGENEKANQIAKSILKHANNDIDQLNKLAKLYSTLGLNDYLSKCIDRIKTLQLES